LEGRRREVASKREGGDRARKEDTEGGWAPLILKHGCTPELAHSFVN